MLQERWVAWVNIEINREGTVYNKSFDACTYTTRYFIWNFRKAVEIRSAELSQSIGNLNWKDQILPKVSTRKIFSSRWIMLEEDNSFTQITQATEGYILAFRSSISNSVHNSV